MINTRRESMKQSGKMKKTEYNNVNFLHRTMEKTEVVARRR